MPIRTIFSHARRWVTVVAEGDLFPADISELLRLIDRHGARSYVKLVDIRRVRSYTRPEGERTLATLVAQRARAGAVGSIAFVTGNNRPCEDAAQADAAAQIEGRPMRAFHEEPSACAWLEMQRIRPWGTATARGSTDPVSSTTAARVSCPTFPSPCRG
jgi:hypothetical protein